jgi:hypothetical protein
MEELERLSKRHDLRSADLAGLRIMLRKLRKGQALSYQETQNLWAYRNRYGRQDATHSAEPQS